MGVTVASNSSYSLLSAIPASSAGHVTQKRLQLADSNGPQTLSLWDVGYTYNSFGQPVTITYPGSGGAAGTSYTYGYDNMNRPYSMSGGGSTVVSNVTYNAAGQPTQTNFSQSLSETRGYNPLNQLTSLTGVNTSLSYNYTAGQDNGQITSLTDLHAGWVDGAGLCGSEILFEFVWEVFERGPIPEGG